MAIATSLIVAGVGAAAALGGAALSSSAQKKAAGRASDTAAATATQNNALQRDIYGKNSAILNPYVTRGNEAGTAINALLGLGGSQQPMQQQPTQQTQQYGAPQIANENAFLNPDNRPSFQGTDYRSGLPSRDSWANGALGAIGAQANGDPITSLKAALPGMSRSQQEAWTAYLSGNPDPDTVYEQRQAAGQMPQASGQGAQGPGAYQNAFQNYLGSTGYQFQMDQGNKAINQGYAARGSLQSGAALKALQTYGQNTATGFFKDYLGLLSNQQGVGLSGASAVAGVGQNYANTVSANNNMAGQTQAQAQLAAGQASANTYGAAANALGSVANAFGSSYAPKPASAPSPYYGVTGNAFGR